MTMAWKMTKKKAKMNMMTRSKRRLKKKRQMRLIDELRQFIFEVMLEVSNFDNKRSSNLFI